MSEHSMSEHQWEYRVRALRMRPRFRKPVALSPDEVMARFETCFKCQTCPYVTNFHDHQVEITIPADTHHFWSPYLNLLVVADDAGAVLDGRFGPNINVWTMFVAAYVVLGLVGGVGLMIGLSQMSIGQPASGFGLAAGCALAICVVYAVAMFGQRLAGPQMAEIRSFVEDAVGGEGPKCAVSAEVSSAGREAVDGSVEGAADGRSVTS